MQDLEWVRAFAQDRSEDAFSRIVEHYGPMVYSSCYRRLHDAHLAEDATQAVFMVLAKKARKLREDVVLGSWLMKVVFYVTEKSKRSSRHQKKHEEAVGRKLLEEGAGPADQAPEWAGVADKLDLALHGLPGKSRKAVILHYLMGKSHKEVGREIGCSENAVTQRLAYALKNLRSKLSSLGVLVSPDLLGIFLKNNTMEPVPAGLTQGINKAVLGKVAATAQALALSEGAMDMMMWVKVKVVAVVCVGVLLLGGVGHNVAAGYLWDDKTGNGIVLPPKEQKFGTPVNGLALGLSADRYETVMRGDERWVESVEFTCHFKNIDSKLFRLNAHELPWWEKVHLEIRDPRGRIIKDKSFPANHKNSDPTDKDFPELGKDSVYSFCFLLPGFLGPSKYEFPRPGLYKIKVIYKLEEGGEYFRPCWTGTVTSDEISIKVAPELIGAILPDWPYCDGPKWIPTVKQVKAAKDSILNYIEQSNSSTYLSLNKYRCQYFGISVNGKKRIYCNFFLRAGEKDWKTKVVFAYGGGYRYFHLEYDVESGMCRNFSVNKIP